MRSSAGVGPSIRVSTNEINIDVTSSHVDTSNDIAFATLQSPCRNFIFALRPNIIRVNNNNWDKFAANDWRRRSRIPASRILFVFIYVC